MTIAEPRLTWRTVTLRSGSARVGLVSARRKDQSEHPVADEDYRHNERLPGVIRVSGVEDQFQQRIAAPVLEGKEHKHRPEPETD